MSYWRPYSAGYYKYSLLLQNPKSASLLIFPKSLSLQLRSSNYLLWQSCTVLHKSKEKVLSEGSNGVSLKLPHAASPLLPVAIEKGCSYGKQEREGIAASYFRLCGWFESKFLKFQVDFSSPNMAFTSFRWRVSGNCKLILIIKSKNKSKTKITFYYEIDKPFLLLLWIIER